MGLVVRVSPCSDPHGAQLCGSGSDGHVVVFCESPEHGLSLGQSLETTRRSYPSALRQHLGSRFQPRVYSQNLRDSVKQRQQVRR